MLSFNLKFNVIFVVNLTIFRRKKMNSLQSALFSTGLVPERQAKEIEAQKFLRVDIDRGRLAKALGDQNKRMRILGETSSPDTFRREARKLLLNNPAIVQEILAIAYKQGMQTKKNKGGGRLIANLIQVREALKQGQADVEKLFPSK